MINPQELRIGNLVYEPEGNISAVDELLFDTVNCHLLKWDENVPCSGKIIYEWINPIPLSPEILEMCGFEPFCTKDNIRFDLYEEKEYKVRIITVMKIGREGYNIINETNMGYKIPYYSRCFKYLHQLQNLIFVFTGEELKVNLCEKSHLLL